MITELELQQWTQKIVEHFQPIRVILFGSYANGDARPGSDVDLLVVMPHEDRPFQAAARVRRLLRRAVGYVGALDVMVRSPEELDHRLAMGDSFMQDIIRDGKILYDADA